MHWSQQHWDWGRQGGNGPKNNARENLLGTLRQLASYVQGNCRNDLAILLSSGYQAISINHVQSELPLLRSLLV